MGFEKFEPKMPEAKVETSEEKKEKIAATEDFEPLYETLKSMGGLEGSQEKHYSAEELIGRINEARENALEANVEMNENNLLVKPITSACGLRAKVVELINKEMKKKKVSQLGEKVMNLLGNESEAA